MVDGIRAHRLRRCQRGSVSYFQERMVISQYAASFAVLVRFSAKQPREHHLEDGWLCPVPCLPRKDDRRTFIDNTEDIISNTSNKQQPPQRHP